MSYFLSIETSSEEGSLGIFQKQDNKVISLSYKEWRSDFKKGFRSSSMQNKHSEKLPSLIQDCLNEASLKVKDLNFLSLGIGPGRFTGLRISTSIIKTLSFCFDIPIYPVNSLRILAEPFIDLEKVSVSCMAFKDQVYFAEYNKGGEVITAPSSITSELWYQKLKDIHLCVGDAFLFYPVPEDLKNKVNFRKTCPKASDLAKIIVQNFEISKSITWKDLKLFYIRDRLV